MFYSFLMNCIKHIYRLHSVCFIALDVPHFSSFMCIQLNVSHLIPSVRLDKNEWRGNPLKQESIDEIIVKVDRM